MTKFLFTTFAAFFTLVFSTMTFAFDANDDTDNKVSLNISRLQKAYLSTPFQTVDSFACPKHGLRIPQVLAKGKLHAINDNSVVIRHIFYENHNRFIAFSVIEGVHDVQQKVGDLVQKGDRVGHAKTRAPWTLFHRILGVVESFQEAFDKTSLRKTNGGLTVDHSLKRVQNITKWTRERRHLFVPQNEAVLLLIHQDTRSMTYIQKGRVVENILIGFGQSPGKKVRQGDNKTPRGMYFTVQKYRGKFTQWNGEYFGGHWIKLNYPNAYDVNRGLKHKWLTKKRARAMKKKWRKRALPWGGSRLGGGIGLHGWIESDWSDEMPWLTWGCVVFHNADIKRFYDRIPKGAMVVLM